MLRSLLDAGRLPRRPPAQPQAGRRPPARVGLQLRADRSRAPSQRGVNDRAGSTLSRPGLDGEADAEDAAVQWPAILRAPRSTLTALRLQSPPGVRATCVSVVDSLFRRQRNRFSVARRPASAIDLWLILELSPPSRAVGEDASNSRRLDRNNAGDGPALWPARRSTRQTISRSRGSRARRPSCAVPGPA